MAELNLTNVSDKEWQSFINDIIAVQDKHGLLLVPTFKFNAVQGPSYEWGAMRKPPQDEDTKAKSSDAEGDTVPEKDGA